MTWSSWLLARSAAAQVPPPAPVIRCPWCRLPRPARWIELHLELKHPALWGWILAHRPGVVPPTEAPAA